MASTLAHRVAQRGIPIGVLMFNPGCSAPPPPPAPEAPPVVATPTPPPVAEPAPTGTPWPKDASALPVPEGYAEQLPYGGTRTLVYSTINATSPMEIGGVKCTDWLWVAETRWGCQLAEPYAVPDLGVSVKAQSDLFFYYGSQRPTSIDVSTLAPPQTEVVVDGARCGGVVRLDRDGHLVGCTLTQPHTLSGWAVPAGTDVTLEGGKLARAWGPLPLTRGELSVPAEPAALFGLVTGEPNGAEAPSPPSAWPSGDDALAALVPADALAGVTPLVGEMEGLYGHRLRLSRPVDLAGVLCQGDIEMAYGEWICTLARPYTVAAPAVTVKAGTRQSFHLATPRPTSLSLSTLEPEPSSLELEGVACRDTIGIDAEGRLTACTLAAPHTFGPWTLPEGTAVALEGGRLTGLQLRAPFDFAGLPCKDSVRLGEGTDIDSCVLATTHTVNKWTFPEGTMLGFEVGVLRFAEINSKTKLGDQEVAEGNTVYFERGPDEISSVQETVYGD